MVEIPNIEVHRLPRLYRRPNYWERRTINKRENPCGFLISVNDLQRLVQDNVLDLTTLTVLCELYKSWIISVCIHLRQPSMLPVLSSTLVFKVFMVYIRKKKRAKNENA